jgi:DNA-directed RNA polymerase subunit RPC12/RpoP
MLICDECGKEITEAEANIQINPLTKEKHISCDECYNLIYGDFDWEY